MSVTKLKKEKTNICLKLTSNLCKRVYMALGTSQTSAPGSRRWMASGMQKTHQLREQLFCYYFVQKNLI